MNKLSTILNNAAEFHLSQTVSDIPNENSEYTCIAVSIAVRKAFSDYYDREDYLENVIEPFMESLGLVKHPEDHQDDGEFHEFEKGPERQAVRYAWLKFAAMIAEEGL